MGEVYRADDLKLGQAVALKFLPRSLADRPGRRDRFFAEVRLARQVSHPNVCRVYDVGEVDGQSVLSMEYVDGEDLASLLRRIGRLPSDKALEIARQLCAGLAAAHDRGVLHRDLKPANVMVDGRGRARITDFGLAAAAEDTAAEGEVLGTPTYMAPEQLRGKPASVRSDIYSLGLVLYELWTGQRAYGGSTLAEVRSHKENPPRPPSEWAPRIDPSVEGLILRCLERNPELRPASALQAMAILPGGGDPLAAALAAGETPSPEMVAAFGGKAVVSVRRGAALLVAALTLLAAFAFLPAPESLLRVVSLDRPPEFLSGVAQEITAGIGEPTTGGSAGAGFVTDRKYLEYRAKQGPSVFAWGSLGQSRPGPIRFWYRSSPGPLAAQDPDGEVTESDPAEDRPGMMSVSLDTRGRLLSFRAVSDPAARASATPEPDWTPFFTAAGLEPARFRPAPPRLVPRYFADSRLAWEPVAAGPGDPRRVEAASLAGRPVGFQLVFPWSSPAESPRPISWQLADVAYLTVVLIAWVGGIVLARRNWRLKRGDRRGAFRVAVCLLAVSLTSWLLRADHTSDLAAEWEMAKRAMGSALFWAITLWIVYLALEPFVRARWPGILISWNRLLAWDVRDPLVGRDILIGAVTGVGLHLMLRGEYLAPLLFGRAPDVPMAMGVWALTRPSYAAGQVAGDVRTALIEGMGTLVLLLLLRMVLRFRWVADALLVLALSFILLFWSQPFWIYWPLAICRTIIWIAVLTRVGLLSFATGLFSWYVLFSPINLAAPNFYVGRSVVLLLFLAGLAVWGFVTAVGGTASAAVREPRRVAA
jgi:hypothetical protein